MLTICCSGVNYKCLIAIKFRKVNCNLNRSFYFVFCITISNYQTILKMEKLRKEYLFVVDLYCKDNELQRNGQNDSLKLKLVHE